ncbi:FtsX-like permease family protein [Actinomadura fibrosa]|uniref:FtsX-like permease family protein n=1 Tax=Actinomadura fibrosa TaxID=111802 RepID=A0ABW2XB14_9ACTN|nr:FtsX-like permease family protein [Actinomadura fibrosa]
MTGSGFRVLLPVAAMLARGASRPERRRRPLLVGCSALATFFLLGAVNQLLIRGTTVTQWAGLVSEEDLRPGTALGLALLVVPVLALLHQAGRVTQAARERRLAALRLAGATPGDVRLLGAVEAVRAGTAGAVIGSLGYVAAQRIAMAVLHVHDTGRYAVPLWPIPLVVAVVVAAAVVTSLRVSRRVVVSPVRVTRRASRPAPAAVTLILLPLGVLVMVVGGQTQDVDKVGVPLFYLGGALTAVGVAAGAGRLILASARLAGRWARTPETLLAARALEADPRAASRTMAVVGLVVAGGTGSAVIEWDVLQQAAVDHAGVDLFWLVSIGSTWLGLLFALLVAVTALVVHQAEVLLEDGRSTAALAAAGVPVAALRRTALRRTIIAATPVCAAAALATAVGMAAGLYTSASWGLAAWMAARALLMVAVAIASASAVTLVSNRFLTRAAAPDRLRAE